MQRPNVLLITVDDMNWDAVGAFDCPTPNTTPHIDQLATEGVRFEHAHVTIAVCQPSRSAMLTGRYPHRSGGEGFHNLRLPDVPTLPEILRHVGYSTGILGKVDHSTPYADYEWDMAHDMPELGMGRNPEVYGQYAAEFVRQAVQNGRPFFLMANAHDPHRPFYGNDPKAWYDRTVQPRAVPPSRVFNPDEVVVPGFLPDLPEIRREIAEYYSSVRRADDTVGQLLAVLHGENVQDNTFIMLLSDNGMSFPFAKTNCYLHSTKTPLVVSWPGRIEGNRVDTAHFVSGIDLLPTILEAVGQQVPDCVDGNSFYDILQGKPSAVPRDKVFTQFHETYAKRQYPMRCVQTRRYGYIWNAWADGQYEFKNESQSGRTFAAMRKAAEQDEEVAARVEHFLYRTPEELYDFVEDPDALHNVIDDPTYRSVADSLRAELERWMHETEDPLFRCIR